VAIESVDVHHCTVSASAVLGSVVKRIIIARSVVDIETDTFVGFDISFRDTFTDNLTDTNC